jgi:hypothetical protein
MRLRYCDDKDKYFHPTGIKDVEKNIFDKTACQTLKVLKRFMCHNFKVEMYTFLLYSLTSAQW